MKTFFTTFFGNIGRAFKGKNLLWHALAIALTYIIVVSGFDWWYFLATRSSGLQSTVFPAVIIGGILPMLLPIALIVAGLAVKNNKTKLIGWTLGQAGLIGWFVASFYKVLTGRIQPNMHNLVLDISHNFQFGFMRHGIFWGWPSSHTTVSFAMAVALVILFPKNKFVRYGVLIYALYVGLGVSTNIHWFSDFVAGAIIGTIVGYTVGKRFFVRHFSPRSV